ncbi:hypothetical protein CO174_00225 [Candidatus Uhrbacteria bacterium CG_4_9_14_3_um_filter_50_9]|uniref:Uncharacterized protein n=1 Tax=Candidatus Uhrbacteria bacterium CG_4_9_14_3_um_filter_50_9 TaxID=1975035 RepID=A0A2M7XFB3_9BACT|nr:MAG: hypothetical protein CO174_00225 [Candidatus Uhrbacteria bacterium CG_4_9_14_3_um_filter_50_9]
MQKASASLIVRYAFKDGLRELVLLPVWWYTNGLKRVFLFTLYSMKWSSDLFGLGIWVKNLFVPMYGETSLTGRAISFGVRFVMIIVRGIGVVTLSLLSWIGFVIYVVVLPLSLLGVIINLLALLF